MYDVNKNTAPVNNLKLFSRISSVHTYNTRATTSEHFHTKEFRLIVKRTAFSHVCSKFGTGHLKLLNKDRKKFFKNHQRYLISFKP